MKDIQTQYMHAVATNLAESVGLRLKDITGRSRNKYTAITRELIFLSLREGGFGYQMIGEAFGRSHSTVVITVSRILGALRMKDPDTLRIWEKMDKDGRPVGNIDDIDNRKVREVWMRATK